MIQFVDLGRQYETIKDEVNAKVMEVIESKAFVQGKYAKKFEEEYAALHGLKNVIACSSGSCAVLIAASTLGLQPGDEVITTPHTFIATAEPISHMKAKPVFVDIDPDTYNMDVRKIEAAITPRTKAILPVHIYGNPVNMEEIMRIAAKHNLLVLEDCAHAHLAKYNGKFVGTFGHINAFSFNPGKNLGAFGDAGAVATSDEKLKTLATKMYDHGRLTNYLHDVIGYNLRMDGIQAGVLSVKLKYIEKWTKLRQQHAAKYNAHFAGNSKIKTPVVTPNGEHVYHLYVIQVENRDELMTHLKANGVDVRNQYPVPLHLQPAYASLGYKKGDFPITESVADRCISLPIFPEITDEEIAFIADEVKKVAK
jgi:dTDP-4-amino-4,6-dideoxygalactose transaminase